MRNKSTLWYIIRPQTHCPGQGKTRKARLCSRVRWLGSTPACLLLRSLIGSALAFVYSLFSCVRLLALLPRLFIGSASALAHWLYSRVHSLTLSCSRLRPLAVLLLASFMGRFAPAFVYGTLCSRLRQSTLLPSAFVHWFCSRVRSPVRFYVAVSHFSMALSRPAFLDWIIHSSPGTFFVSLFFTLRRPPFVPVVRSRFITYGR